MPVWGQSPPVSPESRFFCVIASSQSVPGRGTGEPRQHARHEGPSVIKIRYADLPQGLHDQVRSGGRRPVIYLLPGLSPAQRRDALRRLIRTSRRGHGARLRVSGVAFAVARDVSRPPCAPGWPLSGRHPRARPPWPRLAASAVVCYSSRHGDGPARPGPAGPRPRRARRRPGSGRPGPGRPRRGQRPGGAAPRRRAARHAPAGAAGSGSSGSGPSGSAPPGSVPPGSGPSGRAASRGPVPTGTGSAPGGVLPSVPPGAPGPSPAPSPSAAAPGQPGPRPPAQPGGLCLQLGLLGVCISG